MEETPRVLIVDDDEPIRRMLAMSFELDGFEVAAASDGLEAIIQVGLFSPDVVVLDIMMPRMDGLTALGHLRRQPETADLPVVLLSAKADSTDIAIGMRAGASDYVTKPFEADDLVNRIRKVIPPSSAAFARERPPVRALDTLAADAESLTRLRPAADRISTPLLPDSSPAFAGAADPAAVVAPDPEPVPIPAIPRPPQNLPSVPSATVRRLPPLPFTTPESHPARRRAVAVAMLALVVLAAVIIAVARGGFAVRI